MKVHDYMFGVFLKFSWLCAYFYSNWQFFCHIDDFTICLWHLNRIQHVENQMWWKNEPPYLATTPHVIFVDYDLVAIIYSQPLLSMFITLGV